MKRILLSLLSAGVAFAQQPVPPAGPLLKRAPDFSSWIVTFSVSRTPGTEPDPAAGELPPLRKIQVVKTGDIRHAVLVDAEGRRTEMWAAPGIQAFLRPDWKEPLLTDGVNAFDALFVNFSTSDFPGFEWISPRNFRGVEKAGNRECLVFQDKVAHADATTGEAAPMQMAFVDLSTRLPVKLDNGGEIANYRFENPPTARLIVPPDVVSAIEARAARIRETARRPARPF
ncbi:MAG: hypothetical protein IAE94_03610 [Chthoniobacterales bacterium]|nr:hypothetical protein [Chthoniobacterales bacterium]